MECLITFTFFLAFSASTSISDVVRDVKNNSSALSTKNIENFKVLCQEGYGAFSI
jgi:hypothetical protein